MLRTHFARGTLTALLLLVVSAAPASAQTTTYTWNGSVDTSWFEPLNWTAVGPAGPFGPPISSLTNTAIVLAGTTGTTNDMDISVSTNSLTFAANAGAFVVGSSSAETLTIGNGGL